MTVNSQLATPAAASQGEAPPDADDIDDEADLVVRARDGDAGAFEQLYRRYSGRTFALCLRMTGREATAQDCLQEAFVKAWRRLDRFESRSRFGTWLHRIAVNEVLDHQRREARHATDDVDELAIAAPSTRGANLEDLALEKAIATLPDGARNVLVLVALQGYTHEEAGELLGIAAGTCKAQLHRARRLLAERLGGPGTGEGVRS